MRHFVQYHNVEKQGGRPTADGSRFAIFSNKGMAHLLGERVWLVSGEGAKKKTFRLESTFVVSEVERGTPNVASGTVGVWFEPAIVLSGKDWFEDFKREQQNFSLGLREVSNDAVRCFERFAAAQELNPAEAALVRADGLTSVDFLDALRRVEGKLTAAQREMLIGHANSHLNCLSMERLAALGGYDSYESANSQYGRVGRRLADELGIRGLVQQVQLLATSCEDHDAEGHWQWIMRPALVDALRQLWPLDVLPVAIDVQIAAAEIDADDKCADLKATERSALVLARIGQGKYRQQLMALWGESCAVTNCAISAVLVASHAVAWSQCSNVERLDPYNGLLLAASVDRLFDAHLISFADDGTIVVSEMLNDGQLAAVGLSRGSKLKRVEKAHLPYLQKHRRQMAKKP